MKKIVEAVQELQMVRFLDFEKTSVKVVTQLVLEMK